MSLEIIQSISQTLPYTTKEFPFNETTLVFKIGGKMFLLVDIEEPHRITLKSSPNEIIELIERHDWITPGFHMNKTHWITLDLSFPHASQSMVEKLIRSSYNLVYQGLTKKKKQELENR